MWEGGGLKGGGVGWRVWERWGRSSGAGGVGGKQGRGFRGSWAQGVNTKVALAPDERSAHCRIRNRVVCVSSRPLLSVATARAFARVWKFFGSFQADSIAVASSGCPVITSLLCSIIPGSILRIASASRADSHVNFLCLVFVPVLIGTFPKQFIFFQRLFCLEPESTSKVRLRLLCVLRR